MSNGRRGYKFTEDKHGVKRELCYLMPTNSEIAALTYDLEILAEAVFEQERSGGDVFKSPDELAALNTDYQAQCRIFKQIYHRARDYDDLPASLKAI